MSDGPAPSSAERIDRALARIDAATKQLKNGSQSLSKRHKSLRDSMAAAIEAIDGVIAQGNAPHG